VDIEVLLLKGGEFHLEQFVVPAGVFGQPVIRNDVSSLLCLGKMVEDDNGYFRHTQFSRCEQSPMARYNPSLRINQDWAVKAEFCNAGGNLCDLRIGMRTRISGITACGESVDCRRFSLSCETFLA
jgi:hypothetical protein